MTRSRKLLWSAGGLAGLVLFLLVCGIVVLRSDWFREQVRQRIVSEVESATGGQVEIGEFRFDWAQLRAEVRSFVLHGTEKEGEAPLFSAGSVQVGLRIVSMLRRDVDIDSLAVIEPRVRVVFYPDGRTNLPQPPVARRHRKPMEQFLALAIGRFRVERGLLQIDTRQIPLDIRGENLSAAASYNASGPSYDGDVSFRRLYVTAPSVPSVGMDADISASLEADRVSIRSARFATGRSSAQVTGVVEDLRSPSVNLTFDAKVSLTELRSHVKSPVAAAGILNLIGKLSYARASGYAITARTSGAGLSAESAGVRLANLRISSDVEARPDGLTLSRLSVGALGGSFSGSAALDKLKRFRLGGELQDISISEVARLRKIPAEQWDGQISGPVEIEGELVSAGARNLKATAKLAVHATGQGRPVEGLVDLSYDQRAKRLEFGNSSLSTPASRVEFHGALNQRMLVDFTSTDLNDLLPAAAFLGGAAPASLPVTLRNGTAKFSGTVTGGLDKPLVAGQLHLSNFSFQGRAFDRLDTFVSLSESAVEASKLTLDQGGARLQGSGRAVLRNWKPDETGSVAGSFTVAGLQVDKLAAEAGSKIQVRGVVAGTIQLAGTPREPVVTAGLSLTQAAAFGQRLDLARAQVRYAGRSLSAESFQLNSGTARLRGTAVYTHRPESWKSGSLKFEASGKRLPLAEVQTLAGLSQRVEGDLDLQVRGEASVQEGKLLPALLQGTFFLRKVAVDKKPLGDLQLKADTKGGWLELHAAGQIAGSKIAGDARCRLQGNYPIEGKVSFSRTPLSALGPWLPASAGGKFPLGAFAEGTLTFSGAALEPGNWSARLEMPTVEIVPPPGLVTPVTGLRNDGPVLLTVTRKEIRLQSARFVGTGTNLEVSGRIDTATQYNAYDVRIRGAVNLAILHNFDPNLTASGDSTIDASIRGPRSRPEIYGRLELKKSSFYLSGVPNGIDNASGVIFFFRDRATIESLTAETGGGKLTLKGFVGLGAAGPNYRLQATASHVRVRYPEGVSTSFDAALDVTGTARRSLVSGTVTILRSSFSQNMDLGGLLASSSKPLVTPAIQNELLRGMQFDVGVEAAPNARFDTMLTRDIQAEADLRLRGTPYKPVLLGRVSINQGEVNFLGNRYSIGRGEISFLNPVRLEPVVNLDLSTRVRGIDVTMTFTGPVDRLNVTYRSDPPLQINEIIALLAVGRAPTSDPALLARQSERDQSWQQIGASTIVGQALAAPVAGRLQRFFGVSRIKIDPKLTGFGNNPEAQITMEQQVSRDITFTYVTSLAQEQQQLIRVEWNVSRRWSLVAVREENGLFGVEVQFRRQFK